MSRTHRLFQLMQALRQSEPPVTAEYLSDQTGVGVRSIYRDIETLRSLGAIIDGTAGFGYVLIEDASLPPMMFEDEEIEALVLGLKEVQVIGDPSLALAAKHALKKLQARLPEKQSNRLQHAVLGAARFRPIPKPGVSSKLVRQAAWDEMTVTFGYSDGQGRQTDRRVDPLAIVYLDACHCLVAWCHLRQDFRTFRLDRMSDLDITTDSFRPKRVGLLRQALVKIRSERPQSEN